VKYGTRNAIFLTILAPTVYTAVEALELGGASSVDALPCVFVAIQQAGYANLIAGHFCPPSKRIEADYV
jgi:hypothetical protein